MKPANLSRDNSPEKLRTLQQILGEFEEKHTQKQDEFFRQLKKAKDEKNEEQQKIVLANIDAYADSSPALFYRLPDYTPVDLNNIEQVEAYLEHLKDLNNKQELKRKTLASSADDKEINEALNLYNRLCSLISASNCHLQQMRDEKAAAAEDPDSASGVSWRLFDPSDPRNADQDTNSQSTYNM